MLKLTSPGVPDVYRVNEVWDFSLVDPDNRRLVDYQCRRSLLGDLKDQIQQAGDDLTAITRDLLDSSYDGRIKLFVTYRALNYRRAHDQLFAIGSYLPLETSGEKAKHICAFARSLADEEAVVVAPRLVVELTDGIERPPIGEEVWQDTWLALPQGQVGQSFRNLFTGEVLALGERDGTPGLPMASVCGHFPVALLERVAG